MKERSIVNLKRPTSLMKFIGGPNLIYSLIILILIGITIFIYSKVSFIFHPLIIVFSTIVAPTILVFLAFYLFNLVVDLLFKLFLIIFCIIIFITLFVIGLY